MVKHVSKYSHYYLVYTPLVLDNRVQARGLSSVDADGRLQLQQRDENVLYSADRILQMDMGLLGAQILRALGLKELVEQWLKMTAGS